MSAAYDLVALVPGNDDKQALEGILTRHRSMGCAPILRARAVVHPRRDPGCYREAPSILRAYLSSSRYALVVFDHEGSGREHESAQDVRENLLGRLAENGWAGRAEVIVVEPELEAWVFSESPHLAKVVGWRDTVASMQDWMRSGGRLDAGVIKPPRPKETLEALLRHTQTPRSAALYGDLARTVGLHGCTDAAFDRLCTTLRTWFPKPTDAGEP